MACSLSLCNSASAILEKGTQGEERRKKTNTRCSHPKKLMGTPGGFARTPGKTNGRPGSARGAAGRAVSAAGSPGLSLWPPPGRPPGCAPALPLTASPRRRRARQSGTWASGSRWEGALAPCSSSALTSRRLAPPLGCARPVAAALGGSRRAGDAGAVAGVGVGGVKVLEERMAARVRVGTWGAGARRAARAQSCRVLVAPRSLGPEQDEVAPPPSKCQPRGLWQKTGSPEHVPLRASCGH